MLPIEAQKEILEYIEMNLEISSDHAERIAAKYGVMGDPDALQKAYRKDQVNRFLAGFEDEDGHREFRSVSNGFGVRKYVYLPLCNDKWTLKKLRRSIRRYTRSLLESGEKVDTQLETVDGKLNRLTRRIKV